MIESINKKSKNKCLLPLFLIMIFFCLPSISPAKNANLTISYKEPFYQMENVDYTAEFYIWNNGNSTFNGTATTWITGDNVNVRWDYKEYNLTIRPGNYTTIKRNIEPKSKDLYWQHIRIEDKEASFSIKKENSFKVHSWSEAFVILGAITSMIILIVTVKNKT